MWVVCTSTYGSSTNYLTLCEFVGRNGVKHDLKGPYKLYNRMFMDRFIIFYFIFFSIFDIFTRTNSHICYVIFARSLNLMIITRFILNHSHTSLHKNSIQKTEGRKRSSAIHQSMHDVPVCLHSVYNSIILNK